MVTTAKNFRIGSMKTTQKSTSCWQAKRCYAIKWTNSCLAYSRRENIKFFSIPEEDEEDTEETLRNFMEDDLGYRNARTVEIQRVHLLPRRSSDSGPQPIIARFLRYKDVEDVFSLGRHLKGTEYQMFQDLPQEIIKRRRKQMPTFKEAQRNGMRVLFSKSQPDKLL